MKSFLAFFAAALLVASAVAADESSSSKPDPKAGADLYQSVCATCHASGLAGAPKVGDKADWEPRIAEGMAAMMDIAINGKGAMPARGGTQASDDELRDVVLYMVNETDPEALKTLDLNAGAAAADKGEASTGNDAKAEPKADANADADDDGKIDVAAGEAAYKQTCAACHGADGNSSIPAQPSLAQQHPEYLVKQLQEFKDGKRQDAVMTAMAQPLSGSDMRNISWWLASQKIKPGFAKSEELAEAGQKIYRAGLADRHIPACAACHSPNGAGIPSQYPRLAGQFAEYTAKQLKDFGDNSRANSEVMHDIAVYLTGNEIEAVSDYIAGLR